MRFRTPCICGDNRAGRVVQRGRSYRGDVVDVRSCVSCDVARTFPGPDVARLAAGDYQEDSGFEDHVRHLDRFRRYARGVLDKVESRRGLSVSRAISLLDVGCSVGSLLLEARSRGYDVQGLELNKAAAEYGRRQFGLEIRSCRIEEMRAERLAFDVITLTQVLEHLEVPTAVMSGLVRMLKPGGFVLVEVPNYRGFWAHVLGAAWPSWGVTQHLWHFTSETISAVARYSEGVRIAEVTTNRCVDYYSVLPEALSPIVNLPGRFGLGDNLMAIFEPA